MYGRNISYRERERERENSGILQNRYVESVSSAHRERIAREIRVVCFQNIFLMRAVRNTSHSDTRCDIDILQRRIEMQLRPESSPIAYASIIDEDQWPSAATIR